MRVRRDLWSTAEPLMRIHARRSAAFTAFALLTACGSASEDSSDPNIVEASAATRQAIGVVRWSRAEAPSNVTGLDSSGQTVVELKYATTNSDGGALHGYELREHERIATTQFWLGPNSSGTTTFALRNAQQTDGFDPATVLDLMRADLRGSSSGGTSLSGQAMRLSPVDLTSGKDPQLVCGTDIILIDGAESCLGHQTGDDAWAKACAKQAQKTGASAEHNTCWEQGEGSFNDCICIDKSTTSTSSVVSCARSKSNPAYFDRTTKICHFVDAGKTENNSCGKPCAVQNEVCENKVELYSGCN